MELAMEFARQFRSNCDKSAGYFKDLRLKVGSIRGGGGDEIIRYPRF
jgi:hypothetical protein